MTVMSQDHKQFLASSSCEVLEIERDRLQNSCHHLERSIKELEAEIQNNGPDADFKEAIEENIVAIAKQRARIASLQDEIDKAKSAEPEADHYHKIPVNAKPKASTPQQHSCLPQLDVDHSSTAACMNAIPSQQTQPSPHQPSSDDSTMNIEHDRNTQDSSIASHTQANQPQSLWL